MLLTAKSEGEALPDMQCVRADAAPVTGVTLVDLGEHMLPNLMGSYILLQVLVPGLEDRAWVLPPLRTIQTRAGLASLLWHLVNWKACASGP